MAACNDRPLSTSALICWRHVLQMQPEKILLVACACSKSMPNRTGSIPFAASCMLTGLFVHGYAVLSASCMHAGDGLVRVWRVARASQASNSLLGTMRGAHALHSVSALSLDKAHNSQVCLSIPDCCQGGYYPRRDDFACTNWCASKSSSVSKPSF